MISAKLIIKYLLCISMMTVTISLLSKQFIPEIVDPSRSSVFQNESDHRIPTIVHFVVGQGDRQDTQHKHPLSVPFIFINYLTFLAARRQIRPEKIYVHYYEEPNTFWWNQTKQDPDINITLVKTRQVHSIFNKSVDHHAHRGDIIRLEVVIKYGGIYLDTDVLALHSFDPLLNLSDVIMAEQHDNPKTACNAVIIGKQNASFLRRVYDAYQSFDQNCWDCHSVHITRQLASIYTNEAKILPTITFFRPGFTESRVFFRSNDYNFSSNYASHLWNKMFNNHLKELTPENILRGNFTLARMLLHAIGKEKIQALQETFLESVQH